MNETTLRFVLLGVFAIMAALFSLWGYTLGGIQLAGGIGFSAFAIIIIMIFVIAAGANWRERI